MYFYTLGHFYALGHFGHTLECDLCPGSLRVQADASRSKTFRERAELRALGATSPLLGATGALLGATSPLLGATSPPLGATGPLLGANNPRPWEVRIPGFACLGNGPPGLAAFQECTRISAKKSAEKCDFTQKNVKGEGNRLNHQMWVTSPKMGDVTHIW